MIVSMTRTICISLFFLFGISLTANAAPNDIHLHYLFQGATTRLKNKQIQWFRALAAEYGYAIADSVTSPSETLGVAGFDIGFEFSLPDIPEDQKHWYTAVEDERPDNNLLISRIRLRKGLPYSLEVDASIGFIHNSSAVIGSLGFKWGIIDGYFKLPDLGLRVGITRAFNAKDLDIIVVNADLSLSKQFGIVGTFSLTPFAGYSFVYVRAGSGVLDPTPMNFDDNERQVDTANFVFFPANLFANRAFFGLRFVWFIVSLTFEGSFTLPINIGFGDATAGFTEDIAQMVSAFNMKFSVFF